MLKLRSKLLNDPEKFNFTLINNRNHYLELIYKIISIVISVEMLIYDQHGKQD